MNRLLVSLPMRTALFVSFLASFFSLSVSTRAQNPAPVIGSQNTVTADPPVARPNDQPCVVQLYSGLEFADFSIKTYQYTPPGACPGPWQTIIFTGAFNVTAGREFDPTAV